MSCEFNVKFGVRFILSFNYIMMKKIFISHSTLDKHIVDIFIDKILVLGLNLEVKDIACTSREDTGVKSGEDIRDFIKENITNCEYVLFMISDNYKKSEICLNEMGAVWATNRNVKSIIFPNTGFDSIGWLYNIKRGIKLDDSAALDSLYEEISEICETKSKVSTWNKQKADFLDFMKNQFNDDDLKISVVVSEEKIPEEFDLLDCREIFDDNMSKVVDSLRKIVLATNKASEDTNKSTKILNNINQNKYFSSTHIRPVLLKLSDSNNTLADICENETLIIKEAFNDAMRSGIKMREISSIDEDSIEEEREAIESLIESINTLINEIISAKEVLVNEKTVLDKTHTKSKNRLVRIYSDMINVYENCIDQANELLYHT